MHVPRRALRGVSVRLSEWLRVALVTAEQDCPTQVGTIHSAERREPRDETLELELFE